MFCVAPLLAACAEGDAVPLSEDDEAAVSVENRPGTIDGTYGKEGRIKSDQIPLHTSGYADRSGKLTAGIYLRDGSMIVAGTKFWSNVEKNGHGAIVMKFSPNGRLDDAFGFHGTLDLFADPDRNTGRVTVFTAIHPRRDGFWIVLPDRAIAYDRFGKREASINTIAGGTRVDAKERLIVRRCTKPEIGKISCTIERFGPDGKSDPSFAPVTMSEGFGLEEMAIAGAGGIIFGSETYGGGGSFIPESGGAAQELPIAQRHDYYHYDSPCSTAFTRDGSILRRELRREGSWKQPRIRKYTKDWQPDLRFGKDGIVSLDWDSPMAGGDNPDRTCIAVDAQDRILVVSRADSWNRARLGVARLLPDGSFDRSFDKDGRMQVGNVGEWFTPLAEKGIPR